MDVALIIGAIVIGIIAGTLSGLLGIGGGLVIVPLTAIILGQTQHISQGVSLAVIVPTSIAGAITHYRKGNVDLRMALFLAIGAVVGSLIGSSVANMLTDSVLRKVFAVVLIVLGYRALPKTILSDIRQRLPGSAPAKSSTT
jgi:hypothetical protein